jgi:hypothetical protein
MGSVFYSKEDQNANLEHYSKKLKDCKDSADLKEFREELMACQKGPSGNFFFEKGKSEYLWKTLYPAHKAKIGDTVQAESADRCEEIMAEFKKDIKSAKTKDELAGIREKVLNTGEFNHVKHKVPLFSEIKKATAKVKAA